MSKSATTHRNKDVPWLLWLIAFPYGRSEAACLADPELHGSPGAGSHCEQTFPSVYGSACEWREGGRGMERVNSMCQVNTLSQHLAAIT